jgi:alpha,alpha-trehalase
MRSFALLAGAQLATALYQNGSIIAPCDSPIYCYGDLLREIELARPFSDSKTFVDLYVLDVHSSNHLTDNTKAHHSATG